MVDTALAVPVVSLVLAVVLVVLVVLVLVLLMLNSCLLQNTIVLATSNNITVFFYKLFDSVGTG